MQWDKALPFNNYNNYIYNYNYCNNRDNYLFISKMMLLLYSTGMRIVITTANLISKDWDQKTQG